MAVDVQQLYSRALDQLRRGQRTEAIETLQRVVRAAPDHYLAHCQLGWAFSDEGDITRAAESFGQAAALRPDWAEALHAKGWALGELGHREHAVATIQRAIACKANVARFYGDLGVNLDRLGRREEAVAALREALRLDPGLGHAYYVNLSSNLAEPGNFEEAIDLYTRACRLDPESVEARYGLGRALSALGRNAEAQQALQQAVMMRPDDPMLHAELGEVLEKQEHWAFALHEYREACRLEPASADQLIAWPGRTSLWGRSKRRSAATSAPSRYNLVPAPPTTWAVHIFTRGGRPMLSNGSVMRTAERIPAASGRAAQ
jgi:protein O-GlcNAc transferase